MTTRRLQAAGLGKLLGVRRVRFDRATAPVVHRVDRWRVRLDKVEQVPNMPGAVDVWGVATRVGVFVYDDEAAPGEAIREYRPPDEVLDATSLATLRGVPFTLDHPADGVTSANASDLTHGWVLDVKVDGDLVLTRIRIATDKAKEWIRAGVVELSCGYSAKLEETAGVTPKGERFDAIQREIRYNHLALVDLARAGHVARLHLDGRRVGVRRLRPRITGSEMFKLRIDGKLLELPALLYPGLVDSAAEAELRADEITTGTVTLETPDGMVELVLPMATIEQVMTMLGASASGDEPAPPAEPPADEADPALEEDDPLAMDAEEETEDSKDDPKKADKRSKLQRLVDSAVERALGKVVGKLDRAVTSAVSKADARAAERAELERKAATVLDAGYAYAKADNLKIAADIVAKADSARATEAKALEVAARKGDLRAAGKLDGLVDAALRMAAERADTSGEFMADVLDLRAQGGERSDSKGAAPWEVARRKRLDALTNGKPKNPKADDEPAAG